MQNTYVYITFYIDDGYANPHGSPHRLRLDRETIQDMDDDELETHISDEIRFWMSQNLHPIFEISDVRDEINEDLQEEES